MCNDIPIPVEKVSGPVVNNRAGHFIQNCTRTCSAGWHTAFRSGLFFGWAYPRSGRNYRDRCRYCDFFFSVSIVVF